MKLKKCFSTQLHKGIRLSKIIIIIISYFNKFIFNVINSQQYFHVTKREVYSTLNSQVDKHFHHLFLAVNLYSFDFYWFLLFFKAKTASEMMLNSTALLSILDMSSVWETYFNKHQGTRDSLLGNLHQNCCWFTV